MAKYTTPEQNPKLFIRCFRALRNSVTRMTPEQWDIVRKTVRPFYIDDVRVLLSFSELVICDAFFKENKAAKEIAKEIDEVGHIPVIEFNEKKGCYRAGTHSFHLPKGTSDSNSKKKLNDPGITRNYILEATWGTDGIQIKGSCQVIRKTNEAKPLHSFVRLTHANDCLLFPAKISNLTTYHAYGDVYVYNFNWSAKLDQDSIETGTTNEDRAYLLHFDFYLGSQKFTSKIGHTSSQKTKDAWQGASATFPSGAEIKTYVTSGGNFEFRRKRP